MPVLCQHKQHILDQVQPAIDLLTNMDALHPDVLLQHAIQPADYKTGLVFRSAIESIRGTFIAASTANREAMVQAVLDTLMQQSRIAEYRQSSRSNRYDFTICIEREPDYFAALEVKGGEGNSINISERPLWAKEFAVWSHLDGAIVNQPSHSVHAIINRLINEMTKRHKLVDVIFFKDKVCGSLARPCPKYPGYEQTIGQETAPDIFLFPERIPTVTDPEPPVHTLHTLKLPTLLLDLFQVPYEEQYRHIWEIRVNINSLPDHRIQSIAHIWHQGKEIDQNISRPWKP